MGELIKGGLYLLGAGALVWRAVDALGWWSLLLFIGIGSGGILVFWAGWLDDWLDPEGGGDGGDGGEVGAGE